MHRSALESASHGHYVAYVLKSGTWYVCDDTSVRIADPLAMARELKLAYLFSYQEDDGVGLAVRPLQKGMVLEELRINGQRIIQPVEDNLEHKDEEDSKEKSQKPTSITIEPKVKFEPKVKTKVESEPLEVDELLVDNQQLGSDQPKSKPLVSSSPSTTVESVLHAALQARRKDLAQDRQDAARGGARSHSHVERPRRERAAPGDVLE